jgi:colanic acid biosynthesis glycosyl transferase WcaI
MGWIQVGEFESHISETAVSIGEPNVDDAHRGALMAAGHSTFIAPMTGQKAVSPVRILLIAQYYWPETIGAGTWIRQLAIDLSRKGHQVTVLTAFPTYPQGRVFPGYSNSVLLREELDGIKVIRTYIFPAAGKSFWPRAASFGSFCMSALWGGLLTPRPDVIYAILPPLPLGWTAELLGLLRFAPVVINIQDIYPDIAISLGYLRNTFAIRVFQKMERSIYQHAIAVVVLADAFRMNLIGKGVPPGKIYTIPNWVDMEAIQPASKSNSVRTSLVADGNLLVVYSGGMGINTCLDGVVEAARILANESHQFVMFGEGAYKESLEAKARGYRLQNLRFLPFVRTEEYPQTLAASDLQIVVLNEAATNASLPSKVLKIMASGRPVLAIAQPDSELSKLVKKAECGVTVSPNDAEGIARTIRQLAREPERLDAMGQCSRRYAVDHFDRGRCVAALESVLLGAAGA